MNNNTPKYRLVGNALIAHEAYDANDMLLSFDIINPSSKKQLQGSSLHFDLSDYSRQNESAESNKVLRDSLYKAAGFLSENVPAFTALTASVAESGAQNFLLQNPDATRFGIAVLPGITTNEKSDVNKPVILVGNLDRLTEFSQVGYENHAKTYVDQNGEKQDLRPAVVLLDQLTMASKDLQQWPLPLTYDGHDFGRKETIGNVVSAGLFVSKAIAFNENKTPKLDDLRRSNTPDKLIAISYPVPTMVSVTDSKLQNQKNDAPSEISSVDIGSHSYNIVRDQIAKNLVNNPQFSSQLESTNKQAVNDFGL